MSPRTAARVAALVLALASGCSRSEETSAPAVPAGVHFETPSTFEEARLLWDPPPQPVAYYQVELRVEDGPWGSLDGQVDGRAIGVRIGIASEVPEVVTLQARVRARNAGGASPFSAEASLFRGLRPLVAAAGAIDGVERVRIDITQGSTASPRVLVERSTYDDLSGTWSAPAAVATLEAGVASWLDTSDLAGRAVGYVVRNVASYRGAPVESATTFVGLAQRPGVAPPGELAVAASGGSLALSWTNHSQIATAIRIERAPGLLVSQGMGFEPPFAPVATLPPDASAWSESLPEGAYTYRAVALAGEYPGPSPSAQGVLAPAALATAVVQAPQGSHALRDGDGRLWVAGMAGALRLWEPTTSGWTRHPFDTGGFPCEPGVILDGTGAPHLLYLRPSGSVTPPSSHLVHAWHDGAAWQEEVIAERMVARVFLALDPGGTPHVAWQESTGDFPEVASRGRSGSTVTRLTSALYDPVLANDLSGFGVAADGTLQVLISATGLFLHRLPPGGTWEEEEVQAPGNQGWRGRTALLPGSETVLYTRSAPAGDPVPARISAVTRAGGGWGAPADLAAYQRASGAPWAAVTTGGRVALAQAQESPEGLWLHTWDAAAGAASTRLGQTTGWEPAWLGFTPAGKVWALSPAGPPLVAEQADAGVLRTYLSFEEP